MVIAVSRPASLEPIAQAAMDAISANFVDAAAKVTELSPAIDAALVEPATMALINAGYDLPQDWPAILIGASNLHRTPGQPEALIGGTWQGTLEFHCWLTGEDPTGLFRSLDRYAATIWLILVLADMAQELGGARLLPATAVIGRYPPVGQAVTNQGIVISVDVEFRA